MSINDLYHAAEEQWELSDLSDSGVSCLPNSIFTQKTSHSINGTFALQMQFILNISEPAYDQFQRIQDKEVDVGIENQEFKEATQRNTKASM